MYTDLVCPEIKKTISGEMRPYFFWLVSSTQIGMTIGKKVTAYIHI